MKWYNNMEVITYNYYQCHYRHRLVTAAADAWRSSPLPVLPNTQYSPHPRAAVFDGRLAAPPRGNTAAAARRAGGVGDCLTTRGEARPKEPRGPRPATALPPEHGGLSGDRRTQEAGGEICFCRTAAFSQLIGGCVNIKYIKSIYKDCENSL